MTWCNFQEGFLVLSEKMSSAWSEQWRFADFEERELLHIWVIISPVLGKEPPRGGLPISTAFSIKVVEQLDLNLSRIVWNTLTLIFINIKWWKPVISFHVLKQEKEQSKPVLLEELVLLAQFVTAQLNLIDERLFLKMVVNIALYLKLCW